MSFIGNQILPFNPLATSGKPRDAQRFNGDGVTTTFTLNFRVDNPTDLEVFVENVQQEPLTAYDAIANQIIFTEAPPTGTNNIYVIYRNVDPGVYASIPDGAITFNKLANNIRLFTTDNYTGDGGTITYGLSSDVADANTLFVSIDGVIQRAPIHYTTTANTITFASAPPAASNVHVRHLGFRTTQTITALPANTTISQPVLQSPSITGTSSFTGSLDVYQANSISVQVHSDTSSFVRASIYSNNTNSSGLQMAKYRGTRASPTAVNSGDGVGQLNYLAYGGTNVRAIARIDGFVDTYTSDTNISGNLRFLTNGGSTTPTERMRITSAGVVDLLSGQLKFPATQNASSDANTLDDYEEGTWTATFFDAATGGNQSSTTSTGHYTKIGDMVFFSFGLVDVSTAGMTAGNGVFLTLPFTSSATLSKNNCAAFHVLYRGLNWATGTQLTSYLAAGVSRVQAFTAGDNVGYAALLVSEVGNGAGRFYVSGQFRV